MKFRSEWADHRKVMEALEEDLERIKTDRAYAEYLDKKYGICEMFNSMTPEQYAYVCRKYGYNPEEENLKSK